MDMGFVLHLKLHGGFNSKIVQCNIIFFYIVFLFCIMSNPSCVEAEVS